MTTTLDLLIDAVESELSELVMGGQIGAKSAYFGDIDGPTLHEPVVFFVLDSADRNDNQVIQDSSRLTWDLNYNVYCLYSGIEGRQKFKNARKFVDSVYNLLQTQHSAGQRLNGECFDIDCISMDYGYVAIDRPKEQTMTGGVIRLIIQVIELF